MRLASVLGNPCFLVWTAGILLVLAATLVLWHWRREWLPAGREPGGGRQAGLALRLAALAIVAAAACLIVLACRMVETMSIAAGDIHRTLAVVDRVGRHAQDASAAAGRVFELQAEEMTRTLLSQPRYSDPKRLNHFEARVYSQGGEDGILREIFNRIGVTNRFFVEFGSADGQENNTVFLLRSGWSGLWMDGAQNLVDRAKNKFAPEIQARRLTVLSAFITAENIEHLFSQGGVPAEFDLLSIDIDRNDYWVWSKIERYRPRVVVVEYNSIFPPGVEWVVQYDPQAWWDQTSHFGASVTALEKLGRKKGYLLVGCNLGGLNAFFVREDLAGNHFRGPFTAENHYEPFRPLQSRHYGHPRNP